MEKLEFLKDTSTGIEVISLEQVNIVYPPHTHIGHYIIGIITQGSVSISIGDRKYVCRNGEYFSVAPDVCHSIVPNSAHYSMITICLPCGNDTSRDLDTIKNKIIGNPEIDMKIAAAAEQVHISSYHMIRKFADENGITPHKFQLQCKVRKAQQLLEQRNRVIDVAQMLGFCDQSHLDRVFKKQVGISPDAYSKAAILSKP